MARPEWQLIESQPLPGSEDTIRLLLWPHEEAKGGNRPGEHWVCRVHQTESYEMTFDNSYFWGPDAAERAQEEFQSRLG
jgi:hypothetical protein